MSSDKKLISIDLNYYYGGFNYPTISPFVIEYFDLHEGDKVIGYQDDQEWEGIIRYNPSYPEEKEWYLDITDGNEYSISMERMEGRNEGARSVFPSGVIEGEMEVVQKMLADGIDIDVVKKYTRLSMTRLINMKKNLKK